jgi:hypothetical protein
MARSYINVLLLQIYKFPLKYRYFTVHSVYCCNSKFFVSRSLVVQKQAVIVLHKNSLLGSAYS